MLGNRLVTILYMQSPIASKAARCMLAAPHKQLVDFGMRHARGREELERLSPALRSLGTRANYPL